MFDEKKKTICFHSVRKRYLMKNKYRICVKFVFVCLGLTIRNAKRETHLTRTLTRCKFKKHIVTFNPLETFLVIFARQFVRFYFYFYFMFGVRTLLRTQSTIILYISNVCVVFLAFCIWQSYK